MTTGTAHLFIWRRTTSLVAETLVSFRAEAENRWVVAGGPSARGMLLSHRMAGPARDRWLLSALTASVFVHCSRPSSAHGAVWQRGLSQGLLPRLLARQALLCLTLASASFTTSDGALAACPERTALGASAAWPGPTSCFALGL